MAHEDSGGIDVIFSFFEVLRVVSVAQRSLYPVCVCICMLECMFFLISNTNTYFQKKKRKKLLLLQTSVEPTVFC